MIPLSKPRFSDSAVTENAVGFEIAKSSKYLGYMQRLLFLKSSVIDVSKLKE